MSSKVEKITNFLIRDKYSMSVLHTSLGKGAEEKKRKKFGLLPNCGEGVSEGRKKQTSILEKYFFTEHVESF